MAQTNVTDMTGVLEVVGEWRSVATVLGVIILLVVVGRVLVRKLVTI